MDSSDTSHLTFARKLASNDLESRTQTLTNLAKFFGKSVHLLKEDDVIRIWMGLFYAMWMSDKPAVQRELSENISKLIHSHANPDNSILFIKTFYTTMHREFPKIDRLRHDKFLKFVRIFVHHSLKFLKDQKYTTEIIEKYIGAQTDIWNAQDAQEIQLHVCDVFVDELFYACGKEIPSEAVYQLAGLFVDTLVSTSHSVLKQRINEVLKSLIAASSYCSPKLAPKNKFGLDNNKELFPDAEFVNVKLDELVDWFLKRASTKDQIQNREILYKLKDEALKKQRAEPGFKILPRTSILKTVEETEREEFKRLMQEHKKIQDALPKDPLLNTKKDRKRKKSGDAAKEEVVPEAVKEDEKKAKTTKGKAPTPAPAPVAEEPKQNNNTKNKKQKEAPAAPEEEPKQNKNKKQKLDTPATPAPSAPVEEEKKQNNNNKNKKQKEAVAAPSPVAPKRKEESPSTTATVVTTKKQKKDASGEVVGKVEETVETVVTEDATSKKTEVTTTTTTKAVKKAPTNKKGAKKAEEKVEAVVEEPVVVEKDTNKKGKGKKQVEEVEEAPEETSTKKKTTKAAPVAPVANGKKRKAVEEEQEPAQNGTPAAQNGTPVTKKGKKGAKAEMVTPQKSEPAAVSSPPSTGKKSVRFSKDNHVKEFDKLEAVATTPVTPSSAKPKSVLTTPPAKPKVGKKK